MVKSWQMDLIVWRGDTSVPSSQRLAQVLYTTNPLTQISVTNSKFECQNTAYVAAKIMKFDQTSTTGRPGLFIIEGNGYKNPMPFLNPHTKSGILDPTLFAN